MPNYRLNIYGADGGFSKESSAMSMGTGDFRTVQVVGLRGDGTETVEFKTTCDDNNKLPDSQRGWKTCLNHEGKLIIMDSDDQQCMFRCEVNMIAVYDGDRTPEENNIKVYIK